MGRRRAPGKHDAPRRPLSSLGRRQPSQEWISNYEAAKTMCIELMKTDLARNYARQPPPYMTDLFDMQNLDFEFARVCSDYKMPPMHAYHIQDSKDFANYVFFKVNPGRHGSLKGHNVQTFSFFNKCDDGKVRKRRIILHIVRDIFAPPICVRPRAIDGVLHLTHAQACLVALKKMEPIIDLLFAMGQYFMTPLTKSVFGRSIDELYAELKEKFAVTYDIAHLLKIINQSLYSGGEKLRYSELAVAAAHFIASTASIENRYSAEKIIRQKIAAYIAVGKKVDIPMFEVFAKYTYRARQGDSVQINAPVDEYLPLPDDPENGGATGGVAEPTEEETSVEGIDESGLEGDNLDNLEECADESSKQEGRLVFSCYICNKVFPSEENSNQIAQH